MSDLELYEMLRDRDVEVISRTERKYGTLGETLAMNITDNAPEANNVLIRGLQKMWYDPVPEEAAAFSVNFLRKIRECAVDSRREKKELPELMQLQELDEAALPPRYEGSYTVPDALGEYIARFISALDDEFRAVFVQRYFLCVNMLRLCEINHYDEEHAEVMLKETVSGLKKFLDKCGASCTAFSLFEAIGHIDDASIVLGTAYQAPERKKTNRNRTLISAAVCAVIAAIAIAAPVIRSAINGEQTDEAYDSTHSSYITVDMANKENGMAFVSYDFGDDPELRVTTQKFVATHPEESASSDSWTAANYYLTGNSRYAKKYELEYEAVPGSGAREKGELDSEMVLTEIKGTQVWHHEYVSIQGTTNCYSADVYFDRDGWTYHMTVFSSTDDRSEGYSEGYIAELLNAMLS